MFWLWGPSSIPWDLGVGERGIIKVLSENEDMVPASGVASDPPQSLVHSRGEPAPLSCK